MMILAATLRTAFSEVFAKRAALATHMIVMIVNDIVWVIFWVLFFDRVGTIRNWNGDRILMLLAVLTTAGGICLGVFANVRHLASLIVNGELDAILTLPVRPLAYLLVRRVEPSNLGDLAFGVVLYAVAGHPTPARTALFVAAVIVSTILILGFLVLIGSTAFFSGRNEGPELGFQAIVLLGSYPVDVFAGVAKVALYTVIPAAFVASIPARLVDSFDPALALAFVAVAFAFAVAGIATFNFGLRRYSSGSVWTRN